MTSKELDNNLRQFYAEARTKDGELYSRPSLLGFRNAIERYLNNPPLNRGISITKGIEFQASNKLLQSQIKLNKRENKENTKHKPAIPEADLQKLKTSTAIRGDNPWGLLRNVWFHINLYWCRRGREGQRELTKQSFEFLVDESGREYVSMTHDEATKNHPGGIDDVNSMEKEARMYSTSDNQLLDGLTCLKMYLQKLNPKCEALFQYPKKKCEAGRARLVRKQTSGGTQTCWNDERNFATGMLVESVYQPQCQSDCHHAVVQRTSSITAHHGDFGPPQ